ncbi:hypothetical protein [Cupriavidus sp. amp6]|uniref:hypothetical protein n=1 Tax=Cupriavidus sp. amp6 TaxID=388051 RepID=UPI0012EB863B|nr:hypothetical protein [Cupriavidus sp. amp6]
MSIQEKGRLLQAWLLAGLPYFDQAGRRYLHLHDVPLEFESAILRWLDLHPELVEYDSPDCVLAEGPKGIAISACGWSTFLTWVKETLDEKLAEMEARSQT